MSVECLQTKRSFLVDSGADISVFPATANDIKRGERGTPMVAANGSTIKSYSTRTITMKLGARRYAQSFVIAAFVRPI